jgi:hypothetical protein
VLTRATPRAPTYAWALARWRGGVQAVLRDEAHALSLMLSLSDAKVVTQADKLQVLESLQEAALEKLAGRNPRRSCRMSNGAMQGAGLPLGDDDEGEFDPLDEARRLLSAWLTADSPRDLLLGLHEEVAWRRGGDSLRDDSLPANALLQVSKCQ